VLPGSGIGTPPHLILPTITLASFQAPIIMRLTRSMMIDVLSQDYIRTARSKGLTEFHVVTGHAVKNAMVPVVTVAGLAVSRIFALSIIVEQIFGMQGVGSLAVGPSSTATSQ
jgi:peptide/nickel transport system permease protein